MFNQLLLISVRHQLTFSRSIAMCGQIKYPVWAAMRCSLNDSMDDELEQNPDHLPMAATEAGCSPVPHSLPLHEIVGLWPWWTRCLVAMMNMLACGHASVSVALGLHHSLSLQTAAETTHKLYWEHKQNIWEQPQGSTPALCQRSFNTLFICCN